VTAVHHNPGLKRDAASVWIEDVTQSSFSVCLRELQNYAGSHEDIHIVSDAVCHAGMLYFQDTFGVLSKLLNGQKDKN